MKKKLVVTPKKSKKRIWLWILSTFIAMGIVGAFYFGTRVFCPIKLVMDTTLRDTMNYCMSLHGNKPYCSCEVADLKQTFPWDDYIKAVDLLAQDKDHIAKVIKKYNGHQEKILAELNCKDCLFEKAMQVIQIMPSPRCMEFFK